jgi:hypothetical protein
MAITDQVGPCGRSDGTVPLDIHRRRPAAAQLFSAPLGPAFGVTQGFFS